jgi:hypothetical protein
MVRGVKLSLVLVLLASQTAPLGTRAQPAPAKQNIFDNPPKREKPVMTPDEVAKMKNDLNATRDRQKVRPGGAGHKSSAAPEKPE